MTDTQSEFIDQLFNTISSDPTMPAELKISLLRLQIPVHKLSLSDPNFISNPKHPARRTFFIAKRLSVLAVNDKSIIDKVDCILSTLLTSSNSINTYSTINQQLEKIETSLQQKPIKRIQTQQQLSHKLKLKLNTKIKLCIEGHDIPSPCQNLILKLWPNSLFYILKTHGENSTQWTKSINMYCDLLDSIQIIRSNLHKQKIQHDYMKIVRMNHKILLRYHPEHKIEASIKALINHYNQLLSDFSSSNSYNKQNIRETILSLPDSVKPGVWCEIYINDTTPTRRLRLSVINTQTGKLIFVNRKGIKKLEKDAADFTEEVKRGLSNIYKHDALFTKPPTRVKLKKIVNN
jgi:uncharacterized protein DUF1631